MSKVITFSRFYPAYHPRKGEPTYFVEKIWNSFTVHTLDQDFYVPFEDDIRDLNNNLSYMEECIFKQSVFNRFQHAPKYHTIRTGKRWKVGDKFSPRVWSGKPYASKQIIIAPDIEIKRVQDFQLDDDGCIFINNKLYAYPNSDHTLIPLAKNDGLEMIDMLNWFNKPFEGQIICWNENIEY